MANRTHTSRSRTNSRDKILNGPLLIRDGFPSLAKTAFAEHGIDCSFGSYDSKEAYIFTGNLCARINFAPRSTDDRIIEGPVTIAEMFPFFKGTGFENGVDAAFEYSADYEAYIFKGDRYALINYKQPRLIGGPKKITDGFHSLRGTIFESGIEAAFASHTKNEAYLFKGDQYALINFAPGGTDDYIITGPKKITPSWPSLATVLPHKNHGLD
ncbi:albumin-2-like [Asparagus officinalis]|uniref:albumin-2-like n=1 Tax=Asparagus officinalis TaxID=4686 RepID=UPI00098E1B53|nr:albumin-2-like [Asparagus officinalis]